MAAGFAAGEDAADDDAAEDAADDDIGMDDMADDDIGMDDTAEDCAPAEVVLEDEPQAVNNTAATPLAQTASPIRRLLDVLAITADLPTGNAAPHVSWCRHGRIRRRRRYGWDHVDVDKHRDPVSASLNSFLA